VELNHEIGRVGPKRIRFGLPKRDNDLHVDGRKWNREIDRRDAKVIVRAKNLAKTCDITIFKKEKRNTHPLDMSSGKDEGKEPIKCSGDS